MRNNRPLPPPLSGAGATPGKRLGKRSNTVIMSILKKIIGGEAKGAVTAVGNVIDGLTASQEEKAAAKNELSRIVQESLVNAMEAQAKVLRAEMSGSWLQRSWRPIVMLSFTALLIIRWTGLSTHHIDLELEQSLMQLLRIGIGGYIAGRSVEKIADRVTQNIDLSFLKKKDRGEYFK